jgi:hypothetical protein
MAKLSSNKQMQGAMSAGLTGTYSTTLIKKMGFTSKQSALLNMPAGVVGITTNLIVGFGIRHTSNRWAWAVGTTLRKSLLFQLTVESILTLRNSWNNWCLPTLLLPQI